MLDRLLRMPHESAPSRPWLIFDVRQKSKELMVHIRFILVVCLVGVAGSHNTASVAASGADDSRSQSEVRAAGREWDGYFNSGDVVKLAALYAEECLSMPPNSPTVSGRKAVQAEFESFFATNVARHETMVDQIIERGDLAIEVARYRLTFRPRAGGAQVVESGRHFEIRRKIDGQWKIVLEIWNSDMPLSK